VRWGMVCLQGSQIRKKGVLKCIESFLLLEVI
jgi:hypothetical protein